MDLGFIRNSGSVFRGYKMNGKKRDPHNGKIRKTRVIAMLTREEMEFIHKLGIDSLFTAGHKLSRVEILSALIQAGISLSICAKGVKTKKELIEKILAAARAHAERRKYPRLKKNLRIGFRKMDSMEHYEETQTENIGMGGFMMDVAYLDKPPQVHQIIEITLKDPNEEGEPIKAIGRISWIREKENNEGLEVGVRITYIKDEYRDKFAVFLSGEESLEIERGGK